MNPPLYPTQCASCNTPLVNPIWLELADDEAPAVDLPLCPICYYQAGQELTPELAITEAQRIIAEALQREAVRR